MGHLEKAWWELVEKFPWLAGRKVKTADIPRNMRISEIQRIILERVNR